MTGQYLDFFKVALQFNLLCAKLVSSINVGCAFPKTMYPAPVYFSHRIKLPTMITYLYLALVLKTGFHAYVRRPWS